MKQSKEPAKLEPIIKFTFDHFKMRDFLAQMDQEDLLEFYKQLEKRDLAQYRELVGSPIVSLSAMQLKAMQASTKFILLVGGRGFGKSRVAAAWILTRLLQGNRKILFMGPTMADILKTQVRPLIELCEPLGIIVNHNGGEKILELPQLRAIIDLDSAESEPRGGNYECGWGDEIVKWKGSRPNHAEEVFRVGFAAVRIGTNPQVIVSTTPKSFPLIKKWHQETDNETMTSEWFTRITGTGLDNPALPDMEKRYIRWVIEKGDRFARQEYLGEIIWEADDPLFKEEWIRRIDSLPDESNRPVCRRIVIGVDPAVTSNKESDNTGIIVAGELAHGKEYVILADHSGKYTPNGWALKVSALYRLYRANTVIIEKNNGGDTLKTILRNADASMHVETVHAMTAKTTRAEPVSAQYETGKVSHYGRLLKLEQEMMLFEKGMANSPDRVDAMVYCILHFLEKYYVKPDLSWFPEH